MRNEQILKYRNLFEKAGEFALFLDGIEASCSRESSAAFLYMQDEDEPESQDNKEDDIARDTALRSKVMEFLVDRILKGDSDSPLHKMLLTHGERPVYVRASHIVRDFWWVEMEVRELPAPGQEESWDPDPACRRRGLGSRLRDGPAHQTPISREATTGCSSTNR